MPPDNDSPQPPPLPAPSTEALALARLRQKAISHPLQQCQLIIYVPPHAVGAIIGRGGRTILSIQQEAKRRSLGHDIGVRIHVVGGISNSSNATNNISSGPATWNYNEYQQQPQQQQPVSQQNNESDDTDDWVPVTIRGDPISCLEAVRLIIPLVDRPQDPTYLTIVFDVPIHRAKHNLLVGKAGILLACLSATYETRVMIPPNELMSNVESSGNIWEQRQQQQQQSKAGSDDAGSAMLFDVGSGDANTAAADNLISNIIQLEGEIDNVEKCLVKMLGIVASEDNLVSTGTIVDCDTVITDLSSTNPPTKPKDGDSNKASPAEKTVARAIIIARTSVPKRIWRSVQRNTNTKIQREKMVEEDAAGDDTEPSLVNEIDDTEGGGGDDDDDDNGDLNKEEPATARPHTKFIITGKNEQSVQKACAQLEKMLGQPLEAVPMSKGEDQLDSEGITSGKKVRKRRSKKKATAQPD